MFRQKQQGNSVSICFSSDFLLIFGVLGILSLMRFQMHSMHMFCFSPQQLGEKTVVFSKHIMHSLFSCDKHIPQEFVFCGKVCCDEIVEVGDWNSSRIGLLIGTEP